MSRYAVHSSYKNSGVEWLGEVPAHWDVVRLASLYREAVRPGDPSLPVLSISIHDGITDEELAPEDRDRQIYQIEDKTKYKRVRPNDLAYNMMRAWQGAFGAVQVDGLVSPAYVVAEPSTDVRSSFIELLLRTPMAIEEMRRYSKGIADFRMRLYWEYFRDIRVCIPPRHEQDLLLDGISRETARIDSLIDKKLQFIALLREKSATLITHAVAKGIDQRAKMKDTGIEWLGEVPAHWTLLPFRFAVWYQEGPGIMAVDFKTDGVPLLRVSGVHGRYASLEGCNFLDQSKVNEKWGHFRVEKGDLLISASATTGTVSEVDEETVGSIPYTGIIRLKPSKRITRAFLKAFVASRAFHEQIELFKAGSTIQHYGPTHLSQMRILLPPIDEQERITKHIDQHTSRIDTLIARTERSIELLREHRSSLIAAAVTGRIDLRRAK